MSGSDKWEFVNALDEQFLKGGVMLSEWTSCLVRDVDIAFCNGANLAAILAAQAAIECHLRYEYSGHYSGDRLGFHDLIEQSPLTTALKAELHSLRRFRNRWVHVNDPHGDALLLERPEANDAELEKIATETTTVLRKVLYLEQCA